MASNWCSDQQREAFVARTGSSGWKEVGDGEWMTAMEETTAEAQRCYQSEFYAACWKEIIRFPASLLLIEPVPRWCLHRPRQSQPQWHAPSYVLTGGGTGSGNGMHHLVGGFVGGLFDGFLGAAIQLFVGRRHVG